MKFIHAATVYTGFPGQRLSPDTVVVDGHTIHDAGRLSEVGEPPETISPALGLDGEVVLPGLIDTHVRQSFDGSPDPVAQLAAGTSWDPALLVSGRPLTSKGGRAWFMGGECASAADMLAIVRQHHDAGTDWVKIVVTGGWLTRGSHPGGLQFRQGQVRAVADLGALTRPAWVMRGGRLKSDIRSSLDSPAARTGRCVA
jgi:hypothetical protein